MIIVTGGAGFIGSNIVKAFNSRGESGILIVDHVGDGAKFKNLLGLDFLDIQSKEDFLADINDEVYSEILGDSPIDCVIHMGACSDTMNYDGDYMLENNYEYTKQVMMFCTRFDIPLIYASSASTYGLGSKGFRESPECEDALNHYAFSKLLFDRYLRKTKDSPVQNEFHTPIIGLRFFNVYGPQERHKGKMASIFLQMYDQLKRDGVIRLFKGIDGVADGEQKRDFIYVRDVVKIVLWFFDEVSIKGVESGIYNCGTGHAHSYNEAARAMTDAFGSGRIEYIDFPDVLRGKYQNFTQADTSKLIEAGYNGGFSDLGEAVRDYVRLLKKNGGYFFD